MPHKLVFYFILSFCILVFAGAQVPQNATVLTIDEAVTLAVQNNLTLRQNAIGLAGQRRVSARSWGGLAPQVSALAGMNRPMSLIDPIPEVINRWTPGFQLQAGINLSVTTFNNITSTRADYEAGIIGFEQARNDLEIQVRKFFYQIILIRTKKEIAAQSLVSARSRFEQSAALARIGRVAILDELNARVDMENHRINYRNIQADYANAMDSFKTMLGISAEQDIFLSGSLDFGFTNLPDSQAVTALAAQGESLEIAALIASIRSLKAQRRAALTSAYLPNLNLTWTSAPQYIFNQLEDSSQWFDSGSLSLTLSINLDSFFPWSNARTQIDSINDSLNITQLRLNESLRNRQDRINQALRTIENTSETIEIMELSVEVAQITYVMYTEMYNRGAIDYQRLRVAAETLLLVQYQKLLEQYNLISALLDLERDLNIPFGSLR